MIVWIDGAYGIGKTTIAYELMKKHKEFLLIESDDSFKNFSIQYPYAAFFGGTIPQNKLSFLNYLKQKIIENINKDMVVVMAVTTTVAKENLIDCLKGEKVKLYHFILEADKDIIISRIMNDHSGRDQEFSESYLEANLDFLKKNYEDAIRVDTNSKTITDIVNYVEKCIWNNVVK